MFPVVGGNFTSVGTQQHNPCKLKEAVAAQSKATNEWITERDSLLLQIESSGVSSFEQRVKKEVGLFSTPLVRWWALQNEVCELKTELVEMVGL
ncbi:unnamed protein product [Arabidopsis thaliana]|uniref:(thale cress) hypothetical protein n=1 Tax=Arabidopsis thaliana TaxID=3702 RepID=A0A7G2EZQ0_ARATH|nr:unnamed protein product [Arabidopsis thaliana]